jgi:hypothetical protein
VQHGVDQLKTFSENGGPILFGTDTGFTDKYDTSLEYELMHRALSVSEILASLTTNPAGYFKDRQKRDAWKRDWTPISLFLMPTLPPTSATSPKLPIPFAAGKSSIRNYTSIEIRN